MFVFPKAVDCAFRSEASKAPLIRTLAICALLALARVSSAQYAYEELGSLGGSSSVAKAANADGSVIVGYSALSTGFYRPFRWTAATGMQDLGLLSGGQDNAYAYGVSADGSVVVGVSSTSDFQSHAFRWSTASGMQDLGTLGGQYSQAAAVSADGSVVVGYSEVASGSYHAFRWTASAGMQDLGTLGGGYSQGFGVSPDGTVIVGSSLIPSPGHDRAFYWTAAGGMQNLGTLGADFSMATGVGVNGVNAVVVGSSTVTASGQRHAFRWTAPGMQDLGSLGGGYAESTGVSADGAVVVGQSTLSNGVMRVFRWDAANGMQALVIPIGRTTAYGGGVSSNGRVIVGNTIGSSGSYAVRWGLDCNGNGILDATDLANHIASDCNGNGTLDSCEIASGAAVDLNADGFPDSCQQSLYSWGINVAGERDVPPGIGKVTSVAGGWAHIVALRADGGVVCWGGDGYGQCTVPSGLGVVSEVGAGWQHTLALKANGTVACWGDNALGQCAVPSGLSGVTMIAAGGLHTLALKSDGSVVGWGSNVELGGDSDFPPPLTNQATVPADLGPAIAIGAGFQHSLVVRANGTVRAWGSNSSGQTTPPAGLTGVVRAVGGSEHSIALKSNGTVASWGSGASGQLDIPPGLSGVVAVASGAVHSLALKSDGTVVSWGSSGDPAAVTPTGLPSIQRIGAGQHASWAIRTIAAPVSTLVSTTSTTCGLSNGAINVTVANAPILSWTGPSGFASTAEDLANLAPGTYTLTARGPDGTTTLAVTVTAAPDTTAPVITSYTASASAAASQNCTAAVPNFTSSVVASDECPGATLFFTQSPLAGTSVGLGANTVTIRVTDAAGNFTTRTATFTVTGSSASYYTDADIDGYGAGAATISCTAIAGKVTNNTDCNDANAAVHPGATEVCNGIDDDCVGGADNGLAFSNYYADADSDGYGWLGSQQSACAPVAGRVTNSADCNDNDASIYPSALELCANAGIDNNCNGDAADVDANAADKVLFYRDQDNDTYTLMTGASFCPGTTQAGYRPSRSSALDCNDGDPAVHPGVTEVCDGIDADCDGIAETDYNQDGTFDCGPLLEMVAMSHAVRVGDTLVVRIHQHASPAPVTGVQLLMHFDQTRLRLDDIALAAGAPYEREGSKSVDNTTGRAMYFAYTLASGVTAAVDVAVLTFTVTAPTSECLATSLLRFEPDGAFRTGCAVVDGTGLVPPTSDLAAIAIDSIAPVIVSYFASASAVASADCTATVPDLASSVVATDNCTIASITQSPAAGTSIGLGSHPITLIVRDAAGNNTAVYPDFIVTGSPASYYADADLDGYGAGAATISCAAIAGKVTNNTDCNDANNAVHPGATEVCNGIDDDCIGGADNGLTFIDYYTDADHDGYGAIGASAQSACAQPTGSAPNNTDCNDANAGVHPGAIEVCGDGLDNNCSGQVDEGCAPFTVFMTPSVAHPVCGESFTVRLSATTPPAGPALTGAQFAVHFDAARLQLASASPVAGGPFQTELAKLIDNAAGTLRYAIGVTPGQQGTNSQAELVDLAFTVRPDAQLCGTASLVWFEAVGPFTTRFSRSGGAASLVPLTSGLGAIPLDVLPPVLAGVPSSDVAVPTDAGSTYGAFVSLPTVTATDECDGAVAVIATGIPSNGIFPIGSTTVTWTAVDATGNTASETRTVTVQPYQLLDIGVCFQGSLPAGATRQVRVRAGAATVLATVVLAPQSGQSCGTAEAVHVPVSAGYPCIEVKDPTHSLTDSAPATVAGVRYGASVVLKQGDSNDDDMIDIVDFGLWVDDFGGPRAADARSNFDANAVVNNGDFSFISVNFFQVGELCVPAANPLHPRDRVSVKQLRREGLGRLESADINRDGWVDAVDVQLFMQGRRSGGAPQRADIPRESGGVAW